MAEDAPRNRLDPKPDFVEVLWKSGARHAGHAGKWGIL